MWLVWNHLEAFFIFDQSSIIILSANLTTSFPEFDQAAMAVARNDGTTVVASMIDEVSAQVWRLCDVERGVNSSIHVMVHPISLAIKDEIPFHS